jgi:bifunctional UDP-N-acetylglucosamine pyrophosphorylase/glucosamine-1-phosphate N-acetyltransferase
MKYSTKPKVLQVLSDKTLLEHVLMQAQALCSQVFVVVGFGAEQVRQAFERLGFLKLIGG